MKNRDMKRYTIFNNIWSSLKLYIQKKWLAPLPTNYIEIKENDKIIYYKGKVWKEIIDEIGLNSTKTDFFVDPLTWEYIDYYLTWDKKGVFINICYELKENIKNIERTYDKWFNEEWIFKFDLSNDCN